MDERTVRFMAAKGIDIARQTPKYLNQIVDLPDYAVIITLDAKTRDLDLPAGSTVNISWEVQDPSQLQGADEQVEAAYEHAFAYLYTHIHDLVEAVFGNGRDDAEGTP
jgi:arsenate reductase